MKIILKLLKQMILISIEFLKLNKNNCKENAAIIQKNGIINKNNLKLS